MAIAELLRPASSIKSDKPKCVDARGDKLSDPVRHQVRARIDDMDRNWFGLEFLKDVYELLVFSVRRDLIGKKHTETQSVDAGTQRTVDVVAGNQPRSAGRTEQKRSR